MSKNNNQTEMQMYPVHEEGGHKHWAAELSSTDTQKACDLIGESVNIDCPECLGGIIRGLQEELMEARHALSQLNPEGWACLENCRFCS